KADAEIATLKDVEVTEDGIEVTPEYAGVEIEASLGEGSSSNPQDRTKDGWGSFPQDWVDFNVGTGQAAYWYTSGGLADAKKAAAPITGDYTSEGVEEEPEEPAEFSRQASHEGAAPAPRSSRGRRRRPPSPPVGRARRPSRRRRRTAATSRSRARTPGTSRSPASATPRPVSTRRSPTVRSRTTSSRRMSWARST